jgi:hypothetical protein
MLLRVRDIFLSHSAIPFRGFQCCSVAYFPGKMASEAPSHLNTLCHVLHRNKRLSITVFDGTGRGERFRKGKPIRWHTFIRRVKFPVCK